MKIIQVASYYPPHLGGGDNVVRAISEELAKNGHDVKVYTSNIGCEQNKLKSKKNLKLHYLNSIEIGHSSIIFSLFFRLMLIPRDSIIHVSVGHAYVPEIVLLVTKIRRMPYVAHFHIDVDPSGKLGFLLKYYKKYFLSHVLRNSATVICLTDEQKYLLKIKYRIPDNKVSVIRNGVGEEFFVNKKNRTISSPIKLLFVGRLVKQKNIQLILKSLKYINKNVHLSIVGDGEIKKELHELVNELKIKNVTFHGHKTGKKLINIYKNSDLYLMASINEGMSLAMLEAMAAGLPIVGSNISSISNLSKNCGLFIDKLDPKIFATAINKIIDDKNLYMKLSSNAVNIAKQYNWNNSVNKIIKIYKNIYNYNYKI